MKKTLLGISCVIAFTASAQITFDYTDLQEGSKVYITNTDTVNSVALGVPSASAQTWDFANLVSHYMSNPAFDSTQNTPYATDFPASNLYTYGPAIMFGGLYGGAPVASQGSDNGYMFWRKDVTGFWTEGFKQESGPYAVFTVLVSPSEMIIGTPATLGTSYQNTSKWEINFNLNATNIDTLYKSETTKTQLGDAWGDLNLPQVNYNNVLRIHESGVKVDSVFSYLNGNLVFSAEISRDTFNNYIYVAKAIHYPLAIVKADKDNTIRSVEYYMTQGNLGVESEKKTELNIYPNPCTDKLYIEGLIAESCATVSIFDLTGKCIENIQIESGEPLDITSLDSGMYLIRIECNGNVMTQILSKK